MSFLLSRVEKARSMLTFVLRRFGCFSFDYCFVFTGRALNVDCSSDRCPTDCSSHFLRSTSQILGAGTEGVVGAGGGGGVDMTDLMLELKREGLGPKSLRILGGSRLGLKGLRLIPLSLTLEG